ncbi:MAG: cysteine desulfurase [Rhodospirillales bacterium]|nr:cysteine desulfurase [Alphaproteobacteria bacterium]MBL6948588.1 cysteine desulfurase [Rhodospirillales bacterium]
MTPETNLGDNSTAAYDIEKIRADFPILSREVYGKPLVYLDNGASAQKPRQVIDAISEVFEQYYSNVHRGVHWTSQQSTTAFEGGRSKVAKFLNAPSENEIIFTRGATESINLVAHSWGRTFLKAGDEVIISHMEHHANIVPWQMLRQELGIDLKVVPIDDDGNFMFDEYENLLSPKTKLVAVTHVSNALGSVVPVKDVIEKAHAQGALVLLDGCQAVPHAAVDVQDLDVDFYVFSGHKLYGPTGIGVLWGREDLLNSMTPYQTGGEMISSVTFEKTTFKKAPHRFEAGTPAIAEAIGLGVAIDYVQAIGLDNIAAHEHGVLQYATERLLTIEGLKIIGTAKEKAAIISFDLDGVHPHDLGTFVDRAGVAVRVGHHCAQPVMDRFGVAATARASFGLYNTRGEVDALVDALEETRKFFG